MTSLGRDAKTIHSSLLSKQVDHAHVPGKAFEIHDSVSRFMNMIGSSLFNEPHYYGEGVGKDGLSPQARAVIDTFKEVCNFHPEDAMCLIRWARDPVAGLKLRTTPQVLLAVAANAEATKKYVRKYSPYITLRADDIIQAFAAYRYLFQGGDKQHTGSLPHSLRKGLAASFRKFSEYDFLKWDSTTRPQFKDVLLMIGGSRKVPNPVTKEVFEYLVNGKLLKPEATPMFVARDKFNKLSDWSGVTPELLKDAGVTWELVISKFGSRKETWESVIPFMGEMALMRNLRNFEQAGISPGAWDKVQAKITSDKETKLLPFRFYTASLEVKDKRAQEAISLALDKACLGLPLLEGRTALFADNSGSCQGATVSDKSKMRVADAGNMLMAVAAKRLGKRALIGVFGDSYKEVPFYEEDSCLEIKGKLEYYAQRADRIQEKYLALPEYRDGKGVGGSTETGLWWALKDLTQRKEIVDRIILLSDLCCYTQGDVNCGRSMSTYFGPGATIASMVEQYRRQVNPNVRVYSVNLQGYSQSQIDPNAKGNYLMSGWSENIFRNIAQVEGGANDVTKETTTTIPLLDVIRTNYLVK